MYEVNWAEFKIFLKIAYFIILFKIMCHEKYFLDSHKNEQVVIILRCRGRSWQVKAFRLAWNTLESSLTFWISRFSRNGNFRERFSGKHFWSILRTYRKLLFSQRICSTSHLCWTGGKPSTWWPPGNSPSRWMFLQKYI